MRFQVSAAGLACATLLAACGGGGGGSGGGAVQSLSFAFPGGPSVAIPPLVATTQLKATASSGGPVTFTSDSPSVCTVNGTTLTLLKAGECAVTATQAGYEGYAPVSERQLFVIPKQPQSVIFRNPGAQPLDTQSLALTASSPLNRPITFTSSTPSVCTVSGSMLSKLANGMCTVTAQQDGDDIYAKVAVVKNIPIGTEKAPALTFMTGFKDAFTTKEGGTINGYAGVNLNGWWCNGWCDQGLAGDSLKFTFNTKLNGPYDGSWIGGYYGLHVLGPALKELSKTGETVSGVHIDSQAAMQFKIGQGAEWFSTGNNGLNVDLVLGHFALKNGKDACNVALRAVVKPGATAVTAYSVALKDLTIGESCGLKDLNAWNELQDHAISQVSFNAQNMNTTMSSTPSNKPTYPTQLTLAGPITFQ
jgi:hypothetical protein